MARSESSISGDAGPGRARAIRITILSTAVLLLIVLSVHTAVSAEGEPGAPTNLAAEVDSVLVILTWDPPEDVGSSPILEYNILRGDAIDNLTGFIKIGDPTFTDSTAPRGTTLFYGVSARNLAGNGPVSNVVEVEVPETTVPSEPRTVAATEKDGVVTLTWGSPQTDGGSAIIGYQILRGTSSGGETQLTTVGVVLEFEDTGVDRGKTYFYQVRAANDIGPGRASGEVSVEVPEEPEEDEPLLSWWVIVAIIVVVVIVLVIVFIRSGGKKGGPEQMAPMDKEPAPDATPPPLMAKDAGR